MRIVQAYGNILETSVPAIVADVSKLPYTKQQIKDAIVAAIRISEDSQMKEQEALNKELQAMGL